MTLNGLRPSVRLRIATALVLSSAAVIFLAPQSASPARDGQRSSLLPPRELTLEIIAERGCIDGVAYPAGVFLTIDEQLTACNDFVQNVGNTAAGLYYRAFHLYENGTTDAHRAQAYGDFTFLIEAGDKSPTVFASRAYLNVKYRNAPEAGLGDINTAIELTAAKPRSRYFVVRAAIHLVIAERDSDEAKVYIALDDVREALLFNPKNKAALKLERLATEILKLLHQKEGRSIQRG